MEKGQTTLNTLKLPLLEGEYWWGGMAAAGQRMPYRNELEPIDLAVDLEANQGTPLLLSSKGRYIWSEEPFAFSMREGELQVEGRGGEFHTGEGHGNLRGAYRYAAQAFFAPSGNWPEELLFTAPQYNLWIELMYEPTQEKGA